MNNSKTKKIISSLIYLVFFTILALTWKNADAYLWIKTLHVIAVISWMAGMLYLPRLFVYHSAVKIGSEVSEQFKIMELKFLKIIINPAMIVTWSCGIWLMFSGFLEHGTWLMIKIVFVLILSGFHGVLSKAQKKFAADKNDKSVKQWRYLNEVPTLLMIGIIIMVIVRPF